MHCCDNNGEKGVKDVHVDPVCGMTIEHLDTKLAADFEGRKYYFCAEACKTEFNRHPESSLKARKPTKPEKKGLWGRYLNRLNKATNGQSIKCH